jgi:hypothetical protein
MFQSRDLFQILVTIAAVIVLAVVISMRRKSHRRFLEEFSHREVCEHLRPALELLKSRGHRVVRAGQRREDLPLEIYLWPSFEPAAIASELQLADPVFVSDRNVLYCQEDWCELHPVI